MKNRNYYIRQTLLIAGMTIICAVFLIPLIFMVTLSFQSQDVIMEDGGAKLFLAYGLLIITSLFLIRQTHRFLNG